MEYNQQKYKKIVYLASLTRCGSNYSSTLGTFVIYLRTIIAYRYPSNLHQYRSSSFLSLKTTATHTHIAYNILCR